MHDIFLTIGYYVTGLGYLLVLIGIVFLVLGYAHAARSSDPGHSHRPPARVILISNPDDDTPPG